MIEPHIWNWSRCKAKPENSFGVRIWRKSAFETNLGAECERKQVEKICWIGSGTTRNSKKYVRGQVWHSKKLEHKLKGGSCTREIIHGIGSEIDGCRYEWILGSQALAVLTSHSSLSLLGSVAASLFAVSKDDHNLVQSTDNLAGVVVTQYGAM